MNRIYQLILNGDLDKCLGLDTKRALAWDARGRPFKSDHPDF
jgi:hypothetical protein